MWYTFFMSLTIQLEQFGLTTSEAKVYLACVELGPDSVQHIAQKAKLNRVTTYSIIEELMKKGFLREEHEKNKRKIAAYPPMKLYDVISHEYEQLERKKVNLEHLVPELKKIAAQTKSATNVIYYEGEEGLKNWATDALETKGELLEWTKIESFTKRFDNYLSTFYFPQKCKLQIPSRFIFLDTPAARAYITTRYIDNPNAPPMKARFISQELFDTEGFMVIFNNRFSIALPKEMRAVTVEDETIANAQRKIWEFGWLHAKDEVQNKEYPLTHVL